jgi:hypothetical protein
MVRTSLSVQRRLMRMQALRQKREAIDGLEQDAWALHRAARSMLGKVDPDAGPQQAAWPKPARAALPTGRRRRMWTSGLRNLSQKMRQILSMRLLRRS